MNTTGWGTASWKSALAAFLVFFLIGSGIVFAKAEKRGAMLFVQKKDGQTVKGELLTVRKGILELLLYESAAKAYVRLDELNYLRIEKRGTFFTSFGTGILAGAVTGALMGLLSGNDKPGFMSWSAGQKALGFGVVLGGIGGVIGGVAGAVRSVDESIDLDVITRERLALVEAKLAARARYRSLLLAQPQVAPPVEPPATPTQASGVSIEGSSVAVPAAEQRSALPKRLKFSRWHFSIVWGKSHSQGADKLATVIERAGFGDDQTHEGFWIFPGSTSVYPTKDTCPKYSWKDFRGEYSLTRSLALGLFIAPLGEHSIWGWRRMDRVDGFLGMEEYGPHFGGRFRGNAYYLTAAFMPMPDMFLSKWMLKVGGGVGLASIKGAFLTTLEMPYSEQVENSPDLKTEKLEFSRWVPALMASAEVESFIGRHLSVGLTASFKYVPFRNASGTLTIPYVHAASNRLEEVVVSVPNVLINAGNFGVGVNLGLHF